MGGTLTSRIFKGIKCVLPIIFLAGITIIMATTPGHAQEPVSVRIAGVRPGESHCGSEVTLTVFGANFQQGWTVMIPDGVETLYTEFISPEELMVGIYIQEDAPAGQRAVQLIDPETGVVATLEEGFRVICPSREPEDLMPGPEVPPPPQLPEPEVNGRTLILILAIALGVGVSLGTRRSVRLRRRRKWQEEAQEEERRDTCRPCTRYCRKVKIEVESVQPRIEHLDLIAYDQTSGNKTGEKRVSGEVVDGLNYVLANRHNIGNVAKLERQIESIAHKLVQSIMAWLHDEPKPKDVFIKGHLEGDKVTFQFILYHCVPKGDVNVWEEQDKWKATIEDRREENVGILHGFDSSELKISEQLALGLTQMLTRFIEEI